MSTPFSEKFLCQKAAAQPGRLFLRLQFPLLSATNEKNRHRAYPSALKGHVPDYIVSCIYKMAEFKYEITERIAVLHRARTAGSAS